jgi:hypothetical protein
VVQAAALSDARAGNPTIGVGFNLRAQLLPVMRAYFGSTSLVSGR